MRTDISTDKTPQAVGPYTQAVKIGNVVVTSGQIPIDPKTGSIGATIEDQTNQVLDNLLALIEASGAEKKDIISTRIFLTNMDDFSKVNSIYADHFDKPYPARTCVEVSKLPKGVMIMAEAMAVLPDNH